MTQEIGFGILGTGMVADFHRRAIEANAAHGARLVAVGSRHAGTATGPRSVKETARRFGAPCVSPEELLAHPEVDVVCVCTPSGMHVEQALAAARHGKHALVEKPMALTRREGRAMLEAFERSGTLLAVALQRRAEPLFARVHQAVRAGDLGRLAAAVVTVPYLRTDDYYASAAWRGTWELDGGGALMNQGIHLVDLLVWFMGDPVAVHAVGGTLARRVEVEDAVAAVLEFEGGAVGTILATTTAAPGFAHRVELYGTRGGIQIEGERVVRWDLADPASATVEPWRSEAEGEAGAGADPGGIAVTGHIGLVRNMVDAVRGEAELLVDGREGLKSLSAIRSIYRAAHLGPA